jgi:GNAT superfamily N-acetyltransferase
MQPYELDSTMICFNYYRDEAIEAVPGFADEFDDDSMTDTVRSYASHYDCIWLNAYEGQRVVGFIGGYLSQCPWNKNLVSANAAFIYLLPSHRGLENFKQLLDAFTEWAKTCNCYEISAGDIGIDMERRQRLYEHFGFKPVLMMTKGIANESI